MAAERPFSPRPQSASLGRMIAAQARFELALTLRNGEQLVLTIAIPALLLLFFGSVHLGSLGIRLESLVPGIMTVAALSTAFTSQAITTGFDRRAGVLKRLSASPLPRAGLIAAKTMDVAAIEIGQLILIVVIGSFMGWRPAGPAAFWPLAILFWLLGTAAFSGLGLLLAGLLRAEATLALANLIFLILVGVGAVVVPLQRYPALIRPFISLLPTSAMAQGLQKALAGSADLGPALVLAVWSAAAIAAAARTFRWE